jgi:hypothetical protein
MLNLSKHGVDEQAQRQLAILHLLGLFDRPASADCLKALRAEIIPELNDALVGLSAEYWKLALNRLKGDQSYDRHRGARVDCRPLKLGVE